MRKVSSIIGSAVFLLIVPGFVAGFVPWWISHWQRKSALFGLPFDDIVGSVLIAVGALGLLDSSARFAIQGMGTPAPMFPTRRLVVTGPYRYMRNPMYASVVSTIIGQALLFGNKALLAYGALVWFLFHVFVLLYEEPRLRATFGAEYDTYCDNVPRWIPRLTPWSGPK